MKVLVPLLDEKIYEQLSTKDQLGYYVTARHKITAGVNGISVIV